MANEFVSVPVPVDRVQEVYELLARPQGSVATADVGQQSGEPVVSRAYRESGEAMRAMLEILAQRPEVDVPMSELAKAVGYTRRQMSGAIGAFTRRWRGRYHGGQNVPLPFDARWDYELRMVVYSMSVEAADEIVHTADL